MEETKLFGSELIVYDKHNRCLLTDGDYELVLQEVQANVKGSPKKLSSWETIGEIKEVGGDCCILTDITLKTITYILLGYT